jgi:hypothetical protein
MKNKFSDSSLSELNTMNMDQLFELNHLIVSLIRHKRSQKNATASVGFRVGQTVKWSGRNGIMKTGIIEKMNPKKAIIRITSESGMSTMVGQQMGQRMSQRWNVPYSLFVKA